MPGLLQRQVVLAANCEGVKIRDVFIMRSLILSFFFFSTLAGAAGQPPPASAPSASAIAGVVLKEPGSEPLKKVLVEVISEDAPQSETYSATTDADGRFRIENVAPARYRLFLERTGFVEVNPRGLKSAGEVFAVQSGSSLEDLVFRMLPTAVIAGRVTDEDGDPLAGARVVVQKKRPGKTTRQVAASEVTNDLGEYRVSGLFPGQYWIEAVPPPDMRDYEQPRVKSPEGQSDNAQPDARYLPTYYPGTYDAVQASVITIKAGDELPVGFTLIPARTYRVRGIITGLVRGQKPIVELIPKGFDGMRTCEVGPDGQFEVRGVGPGSYAIGASIDNGADSLTARQDINVAAADVEGIKLTPLPSFRISGHLAVESRTPVDLTHYTANLRQADVADDLGYFLFPEAFGANASIDRIGNFEWKAVKPGNYIVQIQGGDGQGFFLKSATMGGRDIGTGFTATGPTNLELVISTRGGVTEGSVVEREKDVDRESPVANATVVAVPEEKYRKIPDRFVVGSTDQRGHFTLRATPPGTYTVYAWQDVEDGLWHDPDFLKTQEANGASMRVEDGSRQQITLKPGTIPEEWR